MVGSAVSLVYYCREQVLTDIQDSVDDSRGIILKRVSVTKNREHLHSAAGFKQLNSSIWFVPGEDTRVRKQVHFSYENKVISSIFHQGKFRYNLAEVITNIVQMADICVQVVWTR